MKGIYVERKEFNSERFKADVHLTVIDVQLHFWNTINATSSSSSSYFIFQNKSAYTTKNDIRWEWWIIYCYCYCYCYYYRFTALWILSGTTWVSRYQKKHSPTHTYHGPQSSLICFLHLLRSTASSLLNLRAWQSFCTISVQVFFGLPVDL